MKELYKERKTPNRYGKMTLNMFKPAAGGYPMLRGKAGQIKHVTPILLAIWEEGMGPDPDDLELTVSMALKASRDADFILDDHPNVPRLPPDVAEAFFQHTILYCQLNSKLHNWKELRLFNITQKIHIMVHAGLRAKDLNPRYGWCFMGEDFMNKSRQLLAACTRGNPKHMVNNKALKKYLVFLNLSMSGQAH